MNQKSFIEQYKTALQSFAKLSNEAGAREDYVQGGGGNTSIKLDENLMCIKASGFTLGDIKVDQAYAVLDYQKIRSFYADNKLEELADVETQGTQATKTATIEIEGMKTLRPSVEAGFHAILDRYVLHTHAVYANLVCCAENARALCAQAMEYTGYVYGFVPYVNPGITLTFIIAKEIERVKQEIGKAPQVIFMENHGLIVTH